jgi:hypothetical protein
VLWPVTLGSTIAVAAGVWGCAASSLGNQWRDPNFTSSRMRNVLVIAMSPDNNRRRNWEDQLAYDLGRAGCPAWASYRSFPDALPDTQQVIQLVRDRGFDGVLVKHQGTLESSTRYVPGYVTTQPITYSNPWYGSYYTYYTDVYQPGYTETDENLYIQFDLWSTLDTGRQVWSGVSQTLDPHNTSPPKEVSPMVVNELVHQKLIGGKK